MSRRRRAVQRPVPPDPKYGSPELTRFINRVMERGKKSIARRVVYGALTMLEKETNRPGSEVLELALRNCMPMLEVKPRRVGGATYQVPVEVRIERRQALAHRWVIEAARARTLRGVA
jgi:small subunit ribosomal protein S7